MPSPTLRYRLLALDIDGTVVDSRDEVTPATHRAVRQACDAGIRVVLATGRRYRRALPVVEHLGLDLPLVTASGSLIKHPLDHGTLYSAQLPRDTLCRLLAIIDQGGYETILYADTFADGFDFYCRTSNDHRAELAEFLELNAGCERIWPELVEDPPDGVFGGFAMGSREEMLALDKQLQRALPGELYTHVLRSPRYRGYMCEIAPAGATKWSGILYLAEEWGIAPAEICAVGDDVNDIPMIAGAGLGVAMGNALPEVKAAADRVAPGNDDDGLVEVIRWLLS
jgi:hypothetical protein